MPKAAIFNTIPSDLLEDAERSRTHFQSLGYTVHVERSQLGFPKIPALLCIRKQTTLIIEVCSIVQMPLLKDWVALCKSTPQDQRIAICVPECLTQRSLSKHQAECIGLGIGIYVSSSLGIVEWHPPSDLSLQVHLPSIENLPRSARIALGSAYEQFSRKQWREGFEEACKALEVKARAHLIKSVISGRLTVYAKGVPNNPPLKRLRRMTLGELANTYSRAQPLNATDALIFKTLEAINPDRVGVAHKIHQIKTETSLRKNVGAHMHAIVQALKLLG